MAKKEEGVLTFENSQSFIRYCVGGMLDIPVGAYQRGKFGDYNLLGCFSAYMGFVGRANMHKTGMALSLAAKVCSRIRNPADESDITGIVHYCSEGTADRHTLEKTLSNYPNIDIDSMFDPKDDPLDPTFIVTNKIKYALDEYWEIFKSRAKARVKLGKKKRYEIPFKVKKSDEELIMVLPPEIHTLDSLSDGKTRGEMEKTDAALLDDKSLQTIYMHNNLFKGRIVGDLTSYAVPADLYGLHMAKIQDDIKIDPYAPYAQKLAALKKGLKMSKCPNDFAYATNITWYLSDLQEARRPDGTPMWPEKGQTSNKTMIDVQQIKATILRNKHGPSFGTFSFLLSQSKGYLFSLTEFNSLKDAGEFGMSTVKIGNKWTLDLYPEVTIDRVGILEQLDEDLRLQRALEITSEIYQLKAYRRYLDLIPKNLTELREKIIALGYNWEEDILDSIGYFTLDHYRKGNKVISTLDLLRMYTEQYIPWWYPEDKKKNLKVKLEDKMK